MSDVLSSILGSMEKPPGIPDKDRQKSKGMCYMSSQKVYVICRHKRSMFSVRKAMGTMTVSKSLHFFISESVRSVYRRLVANSRYALLRSEISSGKCAKLHTVAASNN